MTPLPALGFNSTGTSNDSPLCSPVVDTVTIGRPTDRATLFASTLLRAFGSADNEKLRDGVMHSLEITPADLEAMRGGIAGVFDAFMAKREEASELPRSSAVKTQSEAVSFLPEYEMCLSSIRIRSVQSYIIVLPPKASSRLIKKLQQGQSITHHLFPPLHRSPRTPTFQPPNLIPLHMLHPINPYPVTTCTMSATSAQAKQISLAHQPPAHRRSRGHKHNRERWLTTLPLRRIPLFSTYSL